MQPPASNFDDAPLRCVSINDEWVSFVIGALYRLESPLFWSSDQLHGEQELIRLVDSLVNGSCATVTAAALFRHRENLGVHGGGYVPGANPTPIKVLTQFGTGFSLANNQTMTVPPGVWDVHWLHDIIGDGAQNTGAMFVLYKLTPAPVTIWEGIGEVLLPGQRDQLSGRAIITVPVQSTFELWISATQGRATVGLGTAGAGSNEENYGFVRWSKLGDV